MIIQSQTDMKGMLQAGQVVARILKQMGEAARPGVSTAELDALGANLMKKEGALSAPMVSYKFPAFTCISINEEAAHGIPGDRVIQEGDLVNIDVSAVVDGYIGDTGATFPMYPINPQKQKLVEVARAALEVGINAATAGRPVGEIGKAVEAFVKKNGLYIIRDLPGHGVGHKLHEPPQVPNFPRRDAMRTIMQEGMVFTIEPFVSTRAQHIMTMPDGWTLRTKDGSLAAQYEHTVVITKGRPLLLTQLDAST
ncbi:MAG TPA: type I methionyl aminopeptidase [Aggregatilineales bacterium]|nr:type I methionyl aminopeptidase [Aggregatilineales bacterium]